MSDNGQLTHYDFLEDRITIQVGERCFTTEVWTLVFESGLFHAISPQTWNDAIEDRPCYFIDGDPDLFDHILRYLRRGVFPVFYDKAKGHDYALYTVLSCEARFFKIPRLVSWLEEQRYLYAFRNIYTITELKGAQQFNRSPVSDAEFEFYPSKVTEKVYVCP